MDDGFILFFPQSQRKYFTFGLLIGASLLLFWWLSYLNILIIRHVIEMQIVIFLFTAIFHFALEKLVVRFRKSKTETYSEHFLFIILAYCIWVSYEIGYFRPLISWSYFSEHILFLLLYLPIVYFLSVMAKRISNAFFLGNDLVSMVLTLNSVFLLSFYFSPFILIIVIIHLYGSMIVFITKTKIF